MDSENYWSNCTDDFQATLWRNSTQHAPLCFQQPSFIPQTAINSFINPCYPRSPEYSGFINCLPEAYVENDINERNNYNFYYPQFSNINSREYKPCYPLYGNEACSVNMEEMGYIAHSNYQNMKMYPQTSMMKSHEKTNHLKTSTKKKEKSKCRKGKKTPQAMTPSDVPSALNSPIIESHEKLQNDINNVLNYTSNNQLAYNKEVNEYSEIPERDQNHLTDGNTTCNTETKPLNLHTSNLSNNYDQSGGLSCLYNKITNSMLNAESLKNDEQLTEKEDKNTKITPQGAADNVEEVQYFPLIKISDSSENPIIEISKNTLINVNSETPQNYLECEENAHVEEYVFKSIFEGKDENGQDLIVFRKELAEVNATKTITQLENNEKLNSVEYSKGHDAINNEHFSELQAERFQISQDESAVVFCSSIDDYAFEEVVEASETHVNADKIKTDESSNEDITQIKEKQSNKKRKYTESNSSADTSSYSNCEIQNTFNDTSDTSNELNTNYKNNNANSKKDTQELEKQITLKSRKTLDGIQKAYFRKFMNNFKLKNKHIKDNALWDTLETILNEVGGNMMQSMHKAFNSIIETYDKSSNQKVIQLTPAFKKNKKPLQVKLMFKSKKDKHSESTSSEI